jgi:hypothetical protein
MVFGFASALKCLNTNIRIADERLTVLRLWSMCAANAGTVVFLTTAISSSPNQKSSSSETLVFRLLM